LLHVIFLHDKGSSNPLGVYTNRDKIVFNPYFTVKDLHSVLIVLIFLIGFISFFPNYLGHTDNYIMADALVTPSHIVPEWYFLPFYAILRSIPNKLGGIVVLLFAILILLLLPYITISAIKPNVFREGQKFFFWVFIWLVILLGWLGGKPVEQPFLQLSQLFTILYFLNFVFITQLLVLVDMFSNYFWLYGIMVLTFCR
jgi:ubiquinol-cytochrome c reductase cytochrome b subunit